MIKKILIVDDNVLEREIIMRITAGKYKSECADNGEMALEMLLVNPQEYAAIILDIVMPVMDGYQFLNERRKYVEIKKIPVIVITARSDDSSQLKALKLGANGWIPKPFNGEFLLYTISNSISLMETRKFYSKIEIDDLTKINSRASFIEKASKHIKKFENEALCLSVFDIDNFKLVNSEYGPKIADKTLVFLASCLQEVADCSDGICGRIMGDLFALIFRADIIDSPMLVASYLRATSPEFLNSTLFIRVGRYIIRDNTIPVSDMLDKAIIAEQSIRGIYDTHVAIYDEKMQMTFVDNQLMIRDMKLALENNEFVPWFQPQYNHVNGKLIGAEALVRWQHPQKGLIFPNSFIPLFEKNGLIYDLDKYIWEAVCKYIRKWIDQGRVVVPISVNISRNDVLCKDFFETITGLREKYNVPIELFRLELTESAFSEETKEIISIVKKLIDYGFTMEIDDFGSGYSSLNTLKDVPAQILKLDMRFMEENEAASRGGNIIESVIRMAKWLGMVVIAEGVETGVQADFLKSVGCYYIQGYFYSKPISALDFEKLSEYSEKEFKMSDFIKLDSLDNNAFWNPKSLETLIFNSFVGGACIIEYHNRRTLELTRVNDRFKEQFENLYQIDLSSWGMNLNNILDMQNLKVVYRTINKAVDSNSEQTCELILNNPRKINEKKYYRTTARIIAHTTNRYLIYCIIYDISDLRLAQRKEIETANQMQVIMENMNGGISAVSFDENNQVHTIFTNDRYFEMFGYSKEEALLENLNVLSLIVPLDKPKVMAVVKTRLLKDKIPTVLEYRCTKKDGSIIHIRCDAAPTSIDGIGNNIIIAIVTDITENVSLANKERETSDQLEAILRQVGCGITAAIMSKDNPKLLFANAKFYELFDYSTDNPLELLDSNYRAIFAPDREMLMKAVQKAMKSGRDTSIEFRVKKRNGQITWIKADITISHFFGIKEPVELSIFTEITREKTINEQLTFLNDITGEILGTFDIEKGMAKMLKKVTEYLNAERAYVYELNLRDNTFSCSYEYFIEGIKSNKDIFNHCSIDLIGDYYTYLENHNYVDISSVISLPDTDKPKAALLANGVRSLMAIALRKQDKIIGFMGVDNYNTSKSKIKSLLALGKYVETLLVRRDLTKRINANSDSLMAIMNGVPGGFIRLKIVNNKLVPVYFSDGFVKLVRTPRPKLFSIYNNNELSLIHPKEQEMVNKALDDLINKNKEINALKIHFLLGTDEYKYLYFFAKVQRSKDNEKYVNFYHIGVDIEEE